MKNGRRTVAVLATLALALTLQVSCARRSRPSAEHPVTPTPAVTTASPPSGVPSVAPTSVVPRPPRGATSAPRPSPTKTTAVPPLPPSLLGKDLEQIPTGRRVVALTFDAGANPDGVSSILATLSREHVTATFFLTGDFTARYPQAARSIAAAGQRIGNHSVSHPHFPPLTEAQMRGQLLGAEQTIRNVTGRNPRPFFRFPYGDRTPHAIAVVNAQNYLAVRWTVDSLGWQGTSGGRSVASVTQRVLGAARPGEIALMHVGSHPTDRSTLDAAALAGIIAGLRQRGYTFVTLDALLAG